MTASDLFKHTNPDWEKVSLKDFRTEVEQTLTAIKEKYDKDNKFYDWNVKCVAGKYTNNVLTLFFFQTVSLKTKNGEQTFPAGTSQEFVFTKEEFYRTNNNIENIFKEITKAD